MSTPSSSPSSSLSSLSRHTNPLTLTRFLLAERSQFAEATGNFSLLLQSIQLACKIISHLTRKGGIGGTQIYGAVDAHTENSSGDQQKKLDVLANEVMINCLRFSDQAYILCSEENDDAIVLDDSKGGYAVVFDPLDGSSNIDCNLSVGTIFGIYKKDPKSTQKPSKADLLKPGNNLIAAGYAIYDAATMLVLTTKLGVNGFTLDPALGEFILTHRDIRIPKRGKIYSVNEGNSPNWDTPTRLFIERQKKKKSSGRYVGSMAGDIHRTLLYGGVFMYPGDQKNRNGKLRLIYECNPISLLIEQAGGKSTTGRQRVLDIQPTTLHQRCPIFCGSYEDIQEVEQLYQQEDAKNNNNPQVATAKL